jgi:hypothetical protein
VVVLALAMLVLGGHLLLGGMTILTMAGEAPRAADGADATARDLQAVRASLAVTHPVAVRCNALSKIAFALLLLFAVAAVFSSDRRARGAALLAAWAGIGYHLADGLFLFLVVRKGVVSAAPMLASWAASQVPAGTAVPSVGQLISFTDLLIVVSGLVGIAFCVLLLAFFGGRRGRLFFGAGHEPHHGA